MTGAVLDDMDMRLSRFMSYVAAQSGGRRPSRTEWYCRVSFGRPEECPGSRGNFENFRIPRIGSDRPRVRPDRVRADRRVLLPQEPRLPAPPWNPLHHPLQGWPGSQPQEAPLPWRPTTAFRRGGLPRAPCGRVRDQSTQRAPGSDHEVRQAHRQGPHAHPSTRSTLSLPRTSSTQVRQHGDIRGGGCRGGRVVVCRGGLTCPDR